MHFDSPKINDQIRALDTLVSDECYHSFGGKAIPYLGQIWREIDFTAATCTFGVVPKEVAEALSQGKIHSANRNRNLVGFMVENLWGFPVITVSGEQWTKIRRQLVVAVTKPTYGNLRGLDRMIQGIGFGHEYRLHAPHGVQLWYEVTNGNGRS